MSRKFHKNEDLRTVLDFARFYLALGFSIIPLRPRRKIPVIPWKEFQHRQATNREAVRWFGNGRYNIAIVTGEASGICVLDFDSEEAYHGAEEKGLPDTPTVKTAKGFHLYCKYASGIRNVQMSDALPGIDLRAEGGYVVAPPSIHPSGHQYEWEEGNTLFDLPFAEPPDWIKQAMVTPVHPSKRRNGQGHKQIKKNSIQDLFHGVAEGERNCSVARLAGYLFSQGFGYEQSLKCLLKINQRNRPPLPSDEVRKILKSIMKTREHERNSLIEHKFRESQTEWEKARPRLRRVQA